MSSSAGCSSLALHTDDQKESSDDRPACLENPRPAGAESTLTENVASPFQAEPRHCPFRRRSSAGYVPKRRRWMSVGFGIGRIARSFPPRRFQELHHLISILLDAYMQCIYTMIVDITLTLRGQSFEWDAEKAASNFAKHGVAFPEACEVFFDPFFHLVDATAGEEVREAAIGYTENARLLFVVHLMRAEETIRIISARPATAEERKFYERE